jgi:hypothetical protein
MSNKTVQSALFAILCTDFPVTQCGTLRGCQRFELIRRLHLLNKFTSKMNIKVLAWQNLASTFDKLRQELGVIGVTFLSLFLWSKKPEPIGCPPDGSTVFLRKQIYVVFSCRRPKCKFTYNLLTYSMEESPSWKADWFAASQEIPRVLWNPKVPRRTHKRPPTIPILSQPNPVLTPTSHFLKIHPNIILPSTPASPQRSLSLRFPHQNRNV